MRTPLATLTLLALSLLSGSAALIYETVWLRWFRLLFGNTAYAASATLCAFFAGLAIGAALFGRIAARSQRPLRLYAAVELAVAATALIVPFVVDSYGAIYAGLYESLAERRGVFVAVKFGLALVAVVPTATLLGGTLPLLATVFVRDGREMGRRASLLYAVNTGGAALGSAAGALWLPERIGVNATYGVALGLSLAIAVIAVAMDRGGAPAPRSESPARPSFAPRPLLGVAFASGVGTLGLEVLLIHALALVLESSVYSFGAVLIVVLVSLAAGAALVAAASARLSPATVERMLPAALVTQAALLLALPWAIVRGTGGLALYAEATFANGLSLAAFYGAPAFLVAGLVLPLTFRLAEGGATGTRVGGLLAANTVGGIAGSVIASFVLLDGLGLWMSVALLGLGYAVAALAWRGSTQARIRRASVVVAVALVVQLAGASPRTLPVVLLQPSERLLAVEEGAHGVVSVTELATDRLEVDRRLKVDSQYTLSSALAHEHQRRMGHLPLILHGDAKRVMYVGSATGETASAAISHPVEEIVLVEIVPEVQALAAEWFGAFNRNVYRDARTRVVVEDGRNHLRGAPESYDVIVADLFVPWRSGVGAMYSVENFEAARRHLTPGGIFCQWLPIYQLRESELKILVASFLEVFPDATLWRGDFFLNHPTAALVGIAGDAPPVATIEAAARSLGARGVDDRWITDPRGLWMLYLGSLSHAFDLTGVPVNSDSHPVFEYTAARTTRDGRAVMLGQAWPALWRRVIEASGPDDPVFPGRPFASTWAGAAMARANLMIGARGEAALDEAVSLLRSNVPADLLAEPDPTVSEIWPTAAE